MNIRSRSELQTSMEIPEKTVESEQQLLRDMNIRSRSELQTSMEIPEKTLESEEKKLTAWLKEAATKTFGAQDAMILDIFSGTRVVYDE